MEIQQLAKEKKWAWHVIKTYFFCVGPSSILEYPFESIDGANWTAQTVKHLILIGDHKEI